MAILENDLKYVQTVEYCHLVVDGERYYLIDTHVLILTKSGMFIELKCSANPLCSRDTEYTLFINGHRKNNTIARKTFNFILSIASVGRGFRRISDIPKAWTHCSYDDEDALSAIVFKEIDMKRDLLKEIQSKVY